ncbi:hypothetical protein [Roseisalinus antarcticus]|uniref:Tetratricopeptide repeat protein n=1 Tax=Roseisalinus antarcticus TaxID=254357 RepID=A0A1Y5U227_9RHOB|nr:hypothetical protein [Roseisalinus antarcticus]SLN75246.1 hypothetical protein ROA7023_03925 [Roseisalinus antarcticus]
MNLEQRHVVRYYAILCGLFLVSALVAWLLAQEITPPPAPPPDPTLEALQEDPSEDPKDITGRFCLELSPDADRTASGRVGLLQIRQIAVVLAARSQAEAMRLAAAIDQPISERDASVRALLATHFARLALAEGDLEAAEGEAQFALSLDDGVSCFTADAHYLLGRVAAKRGDENTALIAQIAAVERFPDHIPALLEIARLGLVASARGASTEAAGHALLALSNIRGARSYAQSLLREVERLGCRTAECDYLRAVLENWLGLPGAALASLAALERRCGAFSCTESLIGSAASFRPLLAEALALTRSEP